MMSSRVFNTLLLTFLAPLVAGFAPSIDLPTTTQEPTSTTPDPDTLPYFPDGTNRSSLTVPVGRAAVLPCRVLRLKDRIVSWVKKDQDKLDLITFGTNTYVSSPRFSLFHDNPDTWELGITPVREQDAGEYVCQVSIHPPLGYTVTLRVTVPVLKIFDERNTPIKEKFYEVGSSIDLQCVALSLAPDVLPVWSKSGLSPPSGTLSSGNSSEYDPKLAVAGAGEGSVVTWIRIGSASKNDSGNYSCSAPDANPASVRVYVLEGEDSVAMQHSTNTAGVAYPTHFLQAGIFVLLLAVPSILGTASSQFQSPILPLQLMLPMIYWYNNDKTSMNKDQSTLRCLSQTTEYPLSTCGLQSEMSHKEKSLSTSESYMGIFLIAVIILSQIVVSVAAIRWSIQQFRIKIQNIRQRCITLCTTIWYWSKLSHLQQSSSSLRLPLLGKIREASANFSKFDIFSKINFKSVPTSKYSPHMDFLTKDKTSYLSVGSVKYL